MYFRIRDNLTASIRFSLGCQSAFFPAKRHQNVCRSISCVWHPGLLKGEQNRKEKHTWSHLDSCVGGQQKTAQYFLSAALSSQRGTWQCPAPAEGHGFPGRSSRSSGSSPAAWEPAALLYLTNSSYIDGPNTEVAAFNPWCFYELVKCRRLSWTFLTSYDLGNTCRFPLKLIGVRASQGPRSTRGVQSECIVMLDQAHGSTGAQLCPWPQLLHETSRCFARGSQVTPASDSSRPHKSVECLSLL